MDEKRTEDLLKNAGRCGERSIYGVNMSCCG